MNNTPPSLQPHNANIDKHFHCNNEVGEETEIIAEDTFYWMRNNQVKFFDKDGK